MKKVPLTDNSGRWFDMDAAKRFEAGSHIDPQSGREVCHATDSPDYRQTLYLTPHGSFILIQSSEMYYQPDAEFVVEAAPPRAVQWLIANGHQETVKKLDLASEEAQLEL